MWVLRKVRDASGLFYAILGCAVTTFYFLVLRNVNTCVSYSEGYDESLEKKAVLQQTSREWQKEPIQFSERGTSKELIGTSTQDKETNFDEFNASEASLDLSSQFHCDTRYREKVVYQRGKYYAIYNFVQAELEFKCTESITLTAPGDYRFLDNIIPLVDRWRGPISIALYAPGSDFFTTIDAIAYLRNCESELIRQLVSFHIVFETDQMPKSKNHSTLLRAYKDEYDCSMRPPWQELKDEDMYKKQHGLLYPINVVRNVAKLAAQTYLVFPSDIELYPTRNFIPLFLKLVKENMNLFQPGNKNVFVLPIFEVLENQNVPENKTELKRMLKKKTAFIFHQSVCVVCHRVVDSEKWVKLKETEGLGVFSVGKRIGRYMVWEPFFVCTQKEPLWDERMTWEGQNNKMVQAYTMCVMDYDFHVLDNAFLIHKPGVKKKKVQMVKYKNEVRDSSKVIKTISIELQELYGYSSNCSIKYKSVMKVKSKPDLEATNAAKKM